MTDTQTLTLAEFLLARIAEDEERARDWGWEVAGGINNGGSTRTWYETAWRGAERVGFPPARVLAECEAKRRIVERWQETAPTVPVWGGSAGWADSRTQEINETLAEEVLPFLALPYADHEGYRQEWRP